MTSTAESLSYLHSELARVEELMLSQTEDYHPDLRNALSVILASGGKRIRPRIILLIGNMLQADQEKLVILATAIEMLHTASLVHDDLIDGSLLRRGIPTLNSKWSPAATVLTGDFLFASASDMASRTESVEVMGLIARCLMTIVNGEVNQLFSSRCSTDIEEYYRRIYSKTASLFETSTHCAAVISGSDNQQCTLLTKFGFNLGMAFQVVDDILDYTGEEKTVGKPVGGDIRQGLITLPLLYYMERYPQDPLVKRLQQRNCLQDDDEVHQLVQSVAQSEAIELAHQVAVNFVKDAEESMMTFSPSIERDALVEIARYIIERKR